MGCDGSEGEKNRETEGRKKVEEDLDGGAWLRRPGNGAGGSPASAAKARRAEGGAGDRTGGGGDLKPPHGTGDGGPYRAGDGTGAGDAPLHERTV